MTSLAMQKSTSCSSLVDIASESSFTMSTASTSGQSSTSGVLYGISQFQSASALRRHLVRLDIGDWKEKAANLLVIGGAALSANANLLSPSGPGGCDHSPLDRCCNCCTSIPVAMVGVHAARKRRTKTGKIWGASLIGIGAASIAFHGSTGSWRPICRKLDFWSIGCSSSLMVKAVAPNTPPVLTALTCALTPFKPFWVSFANSVAMECKFIEQARRDPSLRRSQKIHAATSLIGLGCYALEDAFPKVPFIHSMWHLLSAASLVTVNSLVDSVERRDLGIKHSQALVAQS